MSERLSDNVGRVPDTDGVPKLLVTLPIRGVHPEAVGEGLEACALTRGDVPPLPPINGDLRNSDKGWEKFTLLDPYA